MLGVENQVVAEQDNTKDALAAQYRIIELLPGRNADGQRVYMYVSVPPALFEKFRGAVRSGAPINPSDFCAEVLYQGIGDEPPPEVQEEMRRKYGCHKEFFKRAA